MYTRLADLSDKSMYSRVTSIIYQYRSQNQGQLDKDLLKIMNTYIQSHIPNHNGCILTIILKCDIKNSFKLISG